MQNCFLIPPLTSFWYIGFAESAKAFWNPFKTNELDEFEKEIQQCKEEVDDELQHALNEAIFQERNLQSLDRNAAARDRSMGRIFRARVVKLNEEEQRWRIQTDERKASA